MNPGGREYGGGRMEIIEEGWKGGGRTRKKEGGGREKRVDFVVG